jgi:hypothetical protein
VLERGLLDAARLDQVLSVDSMTRGGIAGGGTAEGVGEAGTSRGAGKAGRS